ncbi:glycosyltransferase [Dyadobacter luticola]|uniref:Glycosyltransferase n=1 Tax=Dyadobacter luticola TaxID=1979387 RepID=A0A5R9L372_9BACT|nr:glycosyltransferase [Dyadobacter luticola]TLV02837.1 glycosyltransferase [Dyadobacter luticola]
MIKLICDLNISLRGHNAGYVQYIVDHVQEKEGDTIYFLFNKQARELIDIQKSALDATHFYFSDRDFSEEQWSSRLKFDEWKVITAHAAQLRVEEVFIMELTRYEIQIGLKKSPFLISGIEFRPSHRIIIKEGKLSNRLSARYQHFKRFFFESLFLRSSSLHRIFILNDPEGAQILNHQYKSSVFQYTRDPIFDYIEPGGQELEKLVRFDKKKVVFTVFGSLDWRKNINNILAAFGTIDKTLHKHFILLIVGKIPKHFSEQFAGLVRNFKTDNPDVELVMINEFVTDGQMEYYFRNTHVSLVIYPKFYGSSGLLGRAAKYNVISLTPNVGLMSELCRDYGLGYTCDPYSPAEIGRKMVAAFQDVRADRKIDGNRFYREHSPDCFLTLLDF